LNHVSVDQFKVHPFLAPRFHLPSPLSPPPLSYPPQHQFLLFQCGLVGSQINLFTSSLIYGGPIRISTHLLITSFMLPNINRPIVNDSNVLGSLSHIIYIYSDESDPYCLVVFYFSLIVPFCIPFLVCYFCFFSLDSPHSHDSSINPMTAITYVSLIPPGKKP